MITSTTQVIEQALIEAHVSKAKLAAALGMSPQRLNQRFKTGKFTYQELQQIAAAIGGRLQFTFILDNNNMRA